MKKTAFATTLALLLSGCVIIPYPHHAYPHSNVRGKLIDRETGLPVPDVRLSLAGDEATSNAEGEFAFTAKRERKLFVAFPLLPFDPLHHCTDYLTLRPWTSPTNAKYRQLEISVKSCYYSRIPGANHYLKNPAIVDQLGVIELIPAPAP